MDAQRTRIIVMVVALMIALALLVF